MEGWLTPMSISYKGSAQEQEKDLIEVRKPLDVSPNPALKNLKKAESPAEALEILRNEPDYDTLITTLWYLANETSDVNITSPSAHASQLVHVSRIRHSPELLEHSSRARECSNERGCKSNFGFEALLVLFAKCPQA